MDYRMLYFRQKAGTGEYVVILDHPSEKDDREGHCKPGYEFVGEYAIENEAGEDASCLPTETTLERRG